MILFVIFGYYIIFFYFYSKIFFMIKNVFIAEIDDEINVMTDEINDGDTVIGYIERVVESYWIKDATAKNVIDDNGARIIIKNGISCGRTDRQKWFKVIGTLNPINE